MCIRGVSRVLPKKENVCGGHRKNSSMARVAGPRTCTPNPSSVSRMSHNDLGRCTAFPAPGYHFCARARVVKGLALGANYESSAGSNPVEYSFWHRTRRGWAARQRRARQRTREHRRRPHRVPGDPAAGARSVDSALWHRHEVKVEAGGSAAIPRCHRREHRSRDQPRDASPSCTPYPV